MVLTPLQQRARRDGARVRFRGVCAGARGLIYPCKNRDTGRAPCGPPGATRVEQAREKRPPAAGQSAG